ncbi:MAG: carboxypeptidase-like regulatory domain-containing protein [Ferruginibacter sp.]
MLSNLFLPVKKSARLLILLLLIFSTTTVTAQKIIVQGKVKDNSGNPVGFATVSIKGTSIRVTTDATGNFKFIKAAVPAILIFSAVGYEKSEIKIERKNSSDSVAKMDITLRRNTDELKAVVVTSLGAVRQKAALGYSTTSVSSYYLSPGTASSYSFATTNLKAPSRRRDASVDEAVMKDRVPLEYPELKPGKVTKKETSRASASNRSRLLTAGELNDFKKWKMWEDYNTTEFKSYSEKWNLFATERYCVQLQNADKKAIVGERLFLISKTTGDTLWAAVSDNTGKAELWKGLSKKGKDDNLVISVGKETKQFPAIPFIQGITRIVINRSCAVSNKVEIAFLVDATGSMQDEINYLKEELEDVLTKITVKDTSLDLHTGAVFYRDNGDAYLTKVQAFTSGISNTSNFIKQQNADGGGDYPEAVNEGLDAAINKLQWSNDARTRIIFLLMDAPPHDEAREQMTTLIIRAANKGIRIVPVACSGTDKATEFIMRSIALATNGSYLFLTDDSGIGDAHIKPTTDEVKVELLNDLLQRTIEQMCYVNTCEDNTMGQEPVASYNNTEKVRVFPNPTTGPLTIQSNKKLKEIFVADFTGKLLMRIPLNDKASYHFNLAAFPSGTYFIKYVTDENSVGTEKIILIK